MTKPISVEEASVSLSLTSVPHYDRDSLEIGIAHMSVGGFHRSHQALLLHEYLQTHAENWMIHGVGLLESDIDLVQNMNKQSDLYSLCERFANGERLKIIGSIKDMTHGPTEPERVIDLLASSNTKIISLTITEKGYCYDAKGELDLIHPVISRDLAEIENSNFAPRSAIGFLYVGLHERMLRGSGPVTVMSCDNLPGNGVITKRVLLQFADQCDSRVSDWINENCAFPSSMVDRITPAITKATSDFVLSAFGVDDPCAVISEPFIQWIVEDDFISGRPRLEEVGVQFVPNVEPYEKLKVRLLNGSHSALSYIAYLMGYRSVNDAVGDPLISEFLRAYFGEITPTLPAVTGVDVGEYQEILLERFSNPAIADQIQRLAMDGSAKIRNAIVPPLVERITRGDDVFWISFALAAWYRYLRGVDEQGQAIEIIDHLRSSIMDIARENPIDPVLFLSLEDVFGFGLSTEQRFVESLKERIAEIDRWGIRRALEHALRDEN